MGLLSGSVVGLVIGVWGSDSHYHWDVDIEYYKGDIDVEVYNAMCSIGKPVKVHTIGSNVWYSIGNKSL